MSGPAGEAGVHLVGEEVAHEGDEVGMHMAGEEGSRFGAAGADFGADAGGSEEDGWFSKFFKGSAKEGERGAADAGGKDGEKGALEDAKESVQKAIKKRLTSIAKTVLTVAMAAAILNYFFHQSQEDCLCACNYKKNADGTYECLPPKKPNKPCAACGPSKCTDLVDSSDSSDSVSGLGPVVVMFLFGVIGLLVAIAICKVKCIKGGMRGAMMLSMGSVGGLAGFQYGDSLITSSLNDNFVITSECLNEAPLGPGETADTRSATQLACCQAKCVSGVDSDGVHLGTAFSGLEILFECGSELIMYGFIAAGAIVLLSIAPSVMGDCGINDLMKPLGNGSGKSFMSGIGLSSLVPSSKSWLSNKDSDNSGAAIILACLVAAFISWATGIGPLATLLTPIIGNFDDWVEGEMLLLRDMAIGEPDASLKCADVVTPSQAMCKLHECRYDSGEAPMSGSGSGVPKCEACDVAFVGPPPEESDLHKLINNPYAIGALVAGIYAGKKLLTPVFAVMIKGAGKLIVRAGVALIKTMCLPFMKMFARGVMAKIERAVAKLVVHLAERAAAKLAVREGEEVGVTAVAAGATVGTAGLAAPIAAGLTAVMYAGMAADIYDESAFRSYIPNADNLKRRNSIDGEWMMQVFVDKSATSVDGSIPHNQSPPIYPLNNLVAPFKDTRLDEAHPFKIIGDAFVEAKSSYTIYLTDLIGHNKVPPGSELLIKYNECIRVHGSTDFEDWCLHESESEVAFLDMINYNPKERDEHMYKYIQLYMERGAISASEHSQGVTRSENMWEKELSSNSVAIILAGLRAGISPHPPSGDSSWKYKDLIHNYEVGSKEVHGVSLSEGGCALLNQVLNWESHLWYPDHLDATGDLPPKNISQISATKKGPTELPKVVYSSFYRKVVSVTGVGDDRIFVLQTTANPPLPNTFLPIFYPSHSVVETICMLGYGGVRILSEEANGPPADGDVSVLDLLARGDGFGVVGGQEPWAPMLYGTSYDDKMGVCKYETVVANLPPQPWGRGDETYCRRMGRTGILNPNERAAGGATYMDCDDSCGGGCEFARWTIGDEFEHGVDRLNVSQALQHTGDDIGDWWDSWSL